MGYKVFERWFKREAPAKPAPSWPEVNLKGHDVHVSANPTRAATRNAARIARIKQALEHPTARRAELEAELKERQQRS